MSEARALGAAGAAHLALLAALSLGWASLPKPAPAEPDAIAVDLSVIAEVARASAEPSEAPPPPPAPATDDPAESVPEPATPPETPAPTPPEPARVEPPEPAALADAEPELVEDAPPPPRRPRRDTRAIADDLDRALGSTPPAPAPRRPSRRELAAALDDSLGPPTPAPRRAATGKTSPQPRAAFDANAAATLAQAIRGQIVPCWNPPQGMSAAATVTLRLRLQTNGTLAAQPEITGRTGSGEASARRAFDDSAVRAVLRCVPLVLPTDLYAQWRDVELNFDPKDLR